MDELSINLDNKKHSGCVWGASSKIGLKYGWQDESGSYKIRQHYKEELFDEYMQRLSKCLNKCKNLLLGSQQVWM